MWECWWRLCCVGDEEFPEPDEADTNDGGSLHSEQADRDDENAYDGECKIVGFIAILKVLQESMEHLQELLRPEHHVTELLFPWILSWKNAVIVSIIKESWKCILHTDCMYRILIN